MAVKYEISGTIHWIGEKENKSKKEGKEFMVQEFVIYQRFKSNNYTEIHAIKIQTTRHFCNMLLDVQIGDKVTVIFTIKGREFKKNNNTFYFNVLEAIQIFVDGYNHKYMKDRSEGRLWDTYNYKEDERVNEEKKEEKKKEDEKDEADNLFNSEINKSAKQSKDNSQKDDYSFDDLNTGTNTTDDLPF